MTCTDKFAVHKLIPRRQAHVDNVKFNSGFSVHRSAENRTGNFDVEYKMYVTVIIFALTFLFTIAPPPNI